MYKNSIIILIIYEKNKKLYLIFILDDENVNGISICITDTNGLKNIMLK